MSANNNLRRGLAPLALAVAVACALGACKKDDAAAAATGPAAQQAAPAPTPESVVAASVAAMTPDQLRAEASKAYGENRLYAPAGNNAMEYYLALRDKQPADAGASSALTDLLPMTVIATEQGIAREDFGDAKRLAALIEKADAHHPALARLKDSIAKGEAAATQRAETQKLTAEEEAKRQEDLAKKREEDQKKQQEAAKQQLAQQTADQQRTAAAQAAGRYKDEIVPLATRMKKVDKATGTESMVEVTVDHDECNRPDTTLEGLAALKPVHAGGQQVAQGKYVTAGNASQFADGAAACVVMSGEMAAKKGLKPMGLFRGFAVAGVSTGHFLR